MGQIKNILKKEIQEDGIVLYREVKKAMDAWTDPNGRAIAALPERMVVGVIAGKLHPIEGYVGSHVFEEIRIEDKVLYNKCVYNTPVIMTFEINGDRLKAVKIELKNK